MVNHERNPLRRLSSCGLFRVTAILLALETLGLPSDSTHRDLSRTAIADVGSELSLGVVDNELLLIDEAGRRTGYDPATGTDLFEIPESGYSRDSIIDDVTGEPPTETSRFLGIHRPAAATYRLVVTGEKVGPYEVSIRAWSDDASPKPALSIQGFATVGSTDTYELTFDPAPGQPVTVATRVTIDIKPGTYPNSINLGSGGTVPVAIFSTASFDATKVDPLTVTLASAPVKMKGKATPQVSSEDVNGDGRPDLVVNLETEALQLSQTDTQATLEGRTTDGKLIRGSDSARVIP